MIDVIGLYISPMSSFVVIFFIVGKNIDIFIAITKMFELIPKTDHLRQFYRIQICINFFICFYFVRFCWLQRTASTVTASVATN